MFPAQAPIWVRNDPNAQPISPSGLATFVNYMFNGGIGPAVSQIFNSIVVNGTSAPTPSTSGTAARTILTGSRCTQPIPPLDAIVGGFTVDTLKSVDVDHVGFSSAGGLLPSTGPRVGAFVSTQNWFRRQHYSSGCRDRGSARVCVRPIPEQYGFPADPWRGCDPHRRFPHSFGDLPGDVVRYCAGRRFPRHVHRRQRWPCHRGRLRLRREPVPRRHCQQRQDDAGVPPGRRYARRLPGRHSSEAVANQFPVVVGGHDRERLRRGSGLHQHAALECGARLRDRRARTVGDRRVRYLRPMLLPARPCS